MHLSRLVATGFALGALAAGVPTAAVTTSVLFRAGDVAADGPHLTSLDGPIATGPDRVVFRSETSAVLVASGGTFTALAKTGDAAPAAVGGTFASFGDPVLNDAGLVAVSAALDSPNASAAIFLHEAGAFRPILLTGGLVADVNGNGDVLVQTNTQIRLWSHASSRATRLVDRNTTVPGGGRFLRFGRRLVLNDAGTVAFEARFRSATGGTARGIFTAMGTSPLVIVAREGDPSPIGGAPYAKFTTRGADPAEAVAVNATGDVAFTAPVAVGATRSGAVFLHPAGAPTTVVAKVGDLVGGAPLVSISSAYVGIDAAGKVAFKGCVASDDCRLVLAAGGTLTALTGNLERRLASGAVVPATGFAPRLTPGNGVAWQSGEDLERYDGTAVASVLAGTDATPIGTDVMTGVPSIDAAGAVAFRAAHQALYELGSGPPRPLAGSGDAVAGVGTIRALVAHAAGGGTLAFLGVERGGLPFLATLGAGGAAKLVTSGDATPLGGTFDLTDTAFAVDARGVVFNAVVTGGTTAHALFRVSTGGTVTALATAGAPAPGGGNYHDFAAPLVAGRRVVFSADVDSGPGGLFALTGSRARAIVRIGDHLGRGKRRETIADVLASAASGGAVACVVSTGVHDDVLLSARGHLTAIARGGAKALPAGRFGDDFPALALDRGRVAFVATITQGAAPGGLFVSHGGRPKPVVLDGASVVGGGTIALGTMSASLSIVGRTVVLATPVAQGGTSRLAIVRAGP